MGAYGEGILCHNHCATNMAGYLKHSFMEWTAHSQYDCSVLGTILSAKTPTRFKWKGGTEEIKVSDSVLYVWLTIHCWL